MRKGIYGLMAIVRDTYELDPYNTLCPFSMGEAGAGLHAISMICASARSSNFL